MLKVLFTLCIGTLSAVLLMPLHVCTPAYAEDPEPECWALVIAVSEYPSFISWRDERGGSICRHQLEYPDDGAQQLAQQLGSCWGEDHVKSLLDSDATKVDIYYGIKWLADRADSDDTVLLYFSGRGKQPDEVGQVPCREYSQRAGSGYLCPFDSRPPESDYYKIPAISLASWFDGSPSRCGGDRACWFGSPPSRCDPGASEYHGVVSPVDAGGWYDNGRSHCHYEISAVDLARWLGMLNSEKVVIILDTGFAGSFGGELSQDGWVALMACQPQEESLQCPELGRRVFTHHILQSLSNFDVTDTNHDYELSAEEIFGYAEAEMSKGSLTCEAETVSGGGKQHPVISDCYSGELNLLMKVVLDTDAHFPPDTAVLTVDGEPYSEAELPASFIWAAGSVHTFGLSSQVDTEDGTRLVFASWGDGYGSVSRTLSRGGEYTADYKTEYQLTIESPYGDPSGEGWYDSESLATISVAPTQGTMVRRVFTGWSGDLVGNEAAVSLVMDAPKAVTANWRSDYLRVYVLLAGVVVLVGTGVAAYILVRKRSS